MPGSAPQCAPGLSFLLKTDVSQFYPSLYTHAVGWAVDPKLRKRANWSNKKLLGKQLDQALMDMDGKLSQGVPIGNDISFLLTEIVLTQVDKALKIPAESAYRWFDDYELAFETRDRAEAALKKLHRELAKFRLRLNDKKSAISRLPSPAQEEWQEVLRQASSARFADPREMVRYFDAAFRLRDRFPDEQVLLYALGLLFKIRCPTIDVGRIAQSCITQTLLCEPGAAQKAFALLSFWRLNGLTLNVPLVASTINQMIIGHQAGGFSSDIAWALAFCLEQRCVLGAKAGQALSNFDDDCIALQSLHMERARLLPKGFNRNKISKALKDADLDREHWLIAYETVRHGFLKVSEAAVKSNPLFADLLKQKVTFYRKNLPAYASVIHSGGAPDWVVHKWMAILTGKSKTAPAGQAAAVDEESAVVKLIGKDLTKVSQQPDSADDAMVSLLDALVSEEDGDGEDLYST